MTILTWVGNWYAGERRNAAGRGQQLGYVVPLVCNLERADRMEVRVSIKAAAGACLRDIEELRRLDCFLYYPGFRPGAS